MKLNDDKYHPTILAAKADGTANIINLKIKERASEMLLGMTFDKKAKLESMLKISVKKSYSKASCTCSSI